MGLLFDEDDTSCLHLGCYLYQDDFYQLCDCAKTLVAGKLLQEHCYLANLYHFFHLAKQDD
jgi:hypothetical protein